MQTISDTVLSALAASEFGRVSHQGPATMYMAFIVDADEPLAGGTEVSTEGTNYARTAITNNQTNFDAPAGSDGDITVLNGENFVGPRSTAAWHAGGEQINCVRFYDDPTAGTLRGGAMLDPAVTVDAAGITITLEAGQVDITLASA